jgi:hypothetical protein
MCMNGGFFFGTTGCFPGHGSGKKVSGMRNVQITERCGMDMCIHMQWERESGSNGKTDDRWETQGESDEEIEGRDRERGRWKRYTPWMQFAFCFRWGVFFSLSVLLIPFRFDFPFPLSSPFLFVVRVYVVTLLYRPHSPIHPTDNHYNRFVAATGTAAE